MTGHADRFNPTSRIGHKFPSAERIKLCADALEHGSAEISAQVAGMTFKDMAFELGQLLLGMSNRNRHITSQSIEDERQIEEMLRAMYPMRGQQEGQGR